MSASTTPPGSASISPERFARLFRSLNAVIASPQRGAANHDWFINVGRHASELLNFGRARPPSDAEKKELQAGHVTIHGTKHTVNQDFAQQCFHLSSTLKVSERYAASLLQAGFESRARYGRSSVEAALLIYHHERIAAIGCLKELARSAMTLAYEADAASQQVGARIERLVSDLVETQIDVPALPGRPAKTQTTLPERILIELDATKLELQALKAENSIGERLDLIVQERQELGQLLYLLSASRRLAPTHTLALTRWLSSQQDPQDAMVIYVLASLLGCLEVLATEHPDLHPESALALHKEITAKDWTLPQLRCVVLLQWSVLLAMPSFSNEIRVQDEEITSLVIGAIAGGPAYNSTSRSATVAPMAGDALVFVIQYVLAFRQPAFVASQGFEEGTEALATLAPGMSESAIDAEFQEYVLTQVQDLLISITNLFLPLFRRLQRAEEDAEFGFKDSKNKPGQSSDPQRYDIEALFDSISLLCRGRPDAGLRFLVESDGRATRFLGWAIDVEQHGHRRAMLDMVASLASGTEGAWQIHTLLSSEDGVGDPRLFSWARLFDWLQYTYTQFQESLSASRGGVLRSQLRVERADEILLKSFLGVLRNVAHHSVAARDALYQHTGYAALQRLFNLYVCPTSIGFKASTLRALTSFARPDGPSAGRIAADIWQLLETHQVVGDKKAAEEALRARIVSERGTAGTGMFGQSNISNQMQSSASSALEVLEREERPTQNFEATLALVDLLKALLQTPAPIASATPTVTSALGAMNSNQGQAASLEQIVVSLGQAHRSPGLDPYVHFVIERVLLGASRGEFALPVDALRLKAKALGFVERCLACYNLTPLFEADESGVLEPRIVAQLLLHPGFSILKRLLTNTTLLKELFAVICPSDDSGFEVLNSAGSGAGFQAQCVGHALRIFQRVMQLQDVFLQVLLPACSDLLASNQGAQLAAFKAADRLGQPGAYTPLDTLLLYEHRAVVQVALYVHPQRQDIVLLAVRLLRQIAESPAFVAVDRFGRLSYVGRMNRLVGLLEMVGESARVRAGFVGHLEALETGDPDDADTADALEASGGDSYDVEYPSTSNTRNAIASSILDLLQTFTAQTQPCPNLAHVLLGFDLTTAGTSEEVQLLDRSDLEGRGALEAIVALVGRAREGEIGFVERSPRLAEKCYALLHNLCRHPFTSSTTLRFLRSRNDFFVQQLRALKSVPEAVEYVAESSGDLRFADGMIARSSANAVTSSLRIQAHLLDSAAIELHSLSNAALIGPATRLLAVLLGGVSAVVGAGVAEAGLQDDDDDADLLPGGFNSQHKLDGTPRARLLDLLQGMDFKWEDDGEKDIASLNVLAALDISPAASRGSAAETKEFDLNAVVGILAQARTEIERRGELVDARQRVILEDESIIILHYAHARNALRALTTARLQSMQAWRHILDMILARCVHLLRAEARAFVLFDCLGAVLPLLADPGADADTARNDLAAGAVLGLLTSLRQHQQSAAATSTVDLNASEELPVDRLMATLRALLAALVRPGTTASSRGNLYAALINFLQLVKSTAKSGPSNRVHQSTAFDESTMGSAIEADDTISMIGPESVIWDSKSSKISQVEERTHGMISSQLDRLIPIVARDALDGVELWRTVAFTLCDQIAGIKGARNQSPGTKALQILERFGYLRSFVASLKEMDLPLQDVLRPDPTSLNILYVYTAQMGFLTRLAQTAAGAEQLVDARIFDMLGQTDFLASRPEQDQDFVDMDSFLPAAMERFDSLLTPALQLCVSILSVSNAKASTIGDSTSIFSASGQAFLFLERHSSTLAIVLKAPLNEATSLAAINQAQLIVALLVFCQNENQSLAASASSPLFSFHSAVLALVAGFLPSSAWLERVVPHSEEEREMASRLVRGTDGAEDSDEETAYSIAARRAVSQLVNSLLAYLEHASFPRTSASDTSALATTARPVLTPVLRVEASDARSRRPRVSTTHPSLGAAISALEESSAALVDELSTIENTKRMLSDVDAVQLKYWDEVVEDALRLDAANVELDANQRRSLGVRELKHRRRDLRASVLHKFDAVEMLITLLYRHFKYYLDLPPASLRRTLDFDPSRSTTRSIPLFRSGRQSQAGGAADSTLGISEREVLVKEGLALITLALENLEVVIKQADSNGEMDKTRLSFLQLSGRQLVESLHRANADLESTGDMR
ncbi:Uncharacterized conserved protein [Ceraceosorus bombacis]|uniref:Uncharacterized conserved protein n=1 Tax=Ceraceosorus bombacis TaxID=401625 RepID=A0A0P1BCG0_9BASI|nr:Uncharacterized conserved protein [Ceraceosorus bombacis]